MIQIQVDAIWMQCLIFIYMCNSNRQKQQVEKIEAVPVMIIAVLRWRIVRNPKIAISSIYKQYTLNFKEWIIFKF